MASDHLMVAALGRPFILGMLYDARKDELIQGLTLWDHTTLQENTVESTQPSSSIKISVSDSIESKSSLLDINTSLKASFLGGLIEVGGSAKYLNDTKKFRNQSRVTFQYKATTKFKQLLMIDLETFDTQHLSSHLISSSSDCPGSGRGGSKYSRGPQTSLSLATSANSDWGKQKDLIKKGFATHVVTGILYGSNALFVFDSEKLEASSVQDIQRSMEAVIKKIPAFNVEGKVDIKLTDEEKALTNKFSCKFYGDFILDSNPGTFEQAVKTYAELPKLLGEEGENGVPLKVWLMPLQNLDSKAAEVMSGISIGLVRKVEEALEDLKEIEMRCNDSLDDRVVVDFPQIHKHLTTFQELCNQYAASLQQTMAKELLLIRKGETNGSKIQKVFEGRDMSPFSHEKLSNWLDHKEREINVIRSCVEIMQGTKIIPNQSELDREVLASGVEDTLCFVFTSLQMGSYLDLLEAGSINEAQWYYSDEVLTNMREKAKAFHDIAKVLTKNSRFRFLIAAFANEKYKGASIYHYRDGKLVTENFSKPDITNVEAVTDRRDLIWYACDLTLDPDTAHNSLTLSDGNKKVTHGAVQSYPDLPHRFDYYPEVLCREGLTGRCYWEVEWSTGYSEDVAVGVTYIRLGRKGKGDDCWIGGNPMSWALGHRWSPPDPTLYADINCSQLNFPVPATGCTRLGVYLDWPAGTLSYYNASSDTLSHIHTIRTKFSEPVYPAFKITLTRRIPDMHPVLQMRVTYPHRLC
ncbi:stonustoxin subunit beta-like isoform X2 [Dicentrarchus labrax]|uniref:stonustoxin subunit beta-like isoform X2 n=1 Tax=Dicentrarchus labrax TaxID=13489 RepID=UPI0021F50D86|nr:stonustoxin subunit beta-like isoform X2 [Dicentrarchus labrax]